MGHRRMLTTKVTDDDRFTTLPSSAQALYLHLSMSADDDGFCNQVSSSMFKAHATTADLGMLLERKYLYQFDDGVIVIKHWRMANALRRDRYTQTTFKEDLAKLHLDENGAYTMSDDVGCRLVAKRLPQDKLSKDKLNKEKINKREKSERNQIPPTVDMIKAYCKERSNNVDAEMFYDFYESKGWMVGKNKMKDWQSAVRTWERSNKSEDTPNKEKIEEGRKAQIEAERQMEEEHKREMSDFMQAHPELMRNMGL